MEDENLESDDQDSNQELEQKNDDVLETSKDDHKDKELKKVRNEAQSLRKRLRELEEKVKSTEDKEKTEFELLNEKVKDFDKVKSELELLKKEKLVKNNLEKYTNLDVNLLSGLVRISDFEFDGETITNLDEVIDTLVLKYPQLKLNKKVNHELPKSDKQSTGLPNTSDAKNNKGLTLEDVQKMKPDEINKRWAEIKNLLKG